MLNGDADPVIDRDMTGVVWTETLNALREVDPSSARLQSWFCPGGGYRAYQGNSPALRFLEERLGTPRLARSEIDALPRLHEGLDRADRDMSPARAERSSPRRDAW